MWIKLTERKWELKHNGKVLATIFHKPTGKFSVYVSTPLIYQHKPKPSVIGKTYMFDSFELAQAGCDYLLKTQVLEWCTVIVDYYNEQK